MCLELVTPRRISPNATKLPAEGGFSCCTKIKFYAVCDSSDYKRTAWFQFGWSWNWILAGSLNTAKEILNKIFCTEIWRGSFMSKKWTNEQSFPVWTVWSHSASQGATGGQGVQSATNLAVWRVAEQLSFRVLHRARDGAVHQTGHSQLWNAQLSF